MNPTSSTNFFKAFLGVSHPLSYTYLTVSLIAVCLIILFRLFTKKIWPQKKHLAWNFSLYAAIGLGLIFGLIFAGLNQFNGLNTEMIDTKLHYVDDAFFEINSLNRIYATIFLSSIGLIVGPLIFFGLGSKIASYTHSRALWMSIYYMIFAVVLAIGFGIGLYQLFRILPDIKLGFERPQATVRPAYSSILLTVVNWLPKNVFGSSAFSYFSISLLIFAIILGFAVYWGQKHDPNDRHFQLANNFLISGFKVFNVITEFILELLPIGVFALFTNAIITNGGQIFIALAWFIVIFLLALVLMFLMQLTAVWIKVKIDPITYMKKAAKPLLSAFLTSSSSLTVPLTQKALAENFRINKTTATTMPIIGTTMGMVACGALYPAMAAGFVYVIDQPFGVMETIGEINFTIILFFGIFFSSFGLSGVPGVASVVTRNVFAITQLPYGNTIGAVLAIDPIIDMFRTFINVNGIITASLLGDAKSKKKAQKQKSVLHSNRFKKIKNGIKN